MSEIIGKQIECGLGLEDSRGVSKSDAEKWFKKVTANIVERSEKVDDESTMNVLADSLGSRVVKKWIEGDLEGNVHADAIGYILYNIFGTISSSNVSGPVYKHDFSVDNNSIKHPSLSIFAKDGAVQQYAYQNGMVGSLEINAVQDDYVKFVASFIAKDSSSNAATPSYDTEYDFVGRDVKVYLENTPGDLSGATPIDAKEVNLNIDTGLLANHVLGKYVPKDVHNSKMAIEGDFTIDFTDETYKDLYLDDKVQAMRIEIKDTNTDLGNGNNPYWQIDLDEVQIKDWNREGGSDEFVTEPINFKAYYNESTGNQITSELQNVTSEYDTPIS